LDVVITITLGLLATAAVISIGRALRPGTVIDRAIALDGVVSAMICGSAVAAIRHGSILVDIALVGGLLGFLTLSTVARYVGRRGL